jgi:hypothetical protein
LVLSPVAAIGFLFSKTLPLFAVTFVGLLFIIFKITDVFKITSSNNQTTSAYLHQNIVYNGINKKYIRKLYKDFFDVSTSEYLDYFKNPCDSAYNSVLGIPTRYLIKNVNFMEILFEKENNSIEQTFAQYDKDDNYPYLEDHVRYLKRKNEYANIIRPREHSEIIEILD